MLECERLVVDAQCHEGALHLMSALHVFCSARSYEVISVLQHTSDFIVVPCWMNFTVSTPFLSQKTRVISFLAYNICLSFTTFLVNVGISTALTAIWFQHLQMKPRFHHLIFVRCGWEIHRHLRGIALQKSKLKPIYVFCEHLWACSEPIFLKIAIAFPHCDNFLEKIARNLWKFTRRFRHCEKPSSKNCCVNTLNKFITHCRWLTTSLFILNICSPAHLRTFYTTVLQFLHS
jgi:hypothetical protein